VALTIAIHNAARRFAAIYTKGGDQICSVGYYKE
jgi:hypothetical protein